MPMTRKHYVLIARVMASLRMTTRTDDWCAALEVLCEVFSEDNPNFDAKRFRDACYM